MTARERKLAVVVGLLAAFGLVVGGYLFVVEPIVDADRQAAQLEQEIGDKKVQLATITKQNARLADTLRRSLPADAVTAAGEYEGLLSKLLDAAEVPAGSRTIKLKPVDSKAPPLNPDERDSRKQVPAYTAVGLDVTLKGVRYATLLRVLEGYYRLNLLHQISQFAVKRVDEKGLRKSGTGNADLPDLEVQFTSTAISLAGAENRRSVLPAPKEVAAAAGGLGFAGLQQSPGVARGLTPVQFVDVLATAGRDYSKLLLADIFHGPPPPPPPPEGPPPPKEETAAFIRLTMLSRNPADGTGEALIVDLASRDEYAVEVTRTDGRLATRVSKFVYDRRGTRTQRRLYDPDLLDISEETSGTARQFRVVGLEEDGLVLVSRDSGGAGGRPARRGGQSPAGAAAGGAAVSAPPEKVFVWKTGESLTKVRELSAGEGRQAVQRATGEAGETATSTTAGDDGR